MGDKTIVKISVVTATWNCVSTIADCLHSVASQSYRAHEHVVIDGASSDGTLALLQASRDQLAVLLSEPDRGIYDALNQGIERATGDVVGFLHADDVYAHADVLAHIAAAFDADPDLCAVYGDLQYVRKNDTDVVVRHWKSTPFTAGRLAWGWMPPHPTLYVRREWYTRIGGLDTRYRIGVENIMVEVDYPHGDSTWPDTQLVIEKAWGHVPVEELRAMCSENAAALYRHPLPEVVLPR